MGLGYGEEAAAELPWAPDATQLFGKGSVPWNDRGEACERKTKNEICDKSARGYPGRYEAGRPSAVGAEPERVAFHGRPRRRRHGTSVR